MRRMRWLALVAVMALVAVACSDSGGDDAGLTEAEIQAQIDAAKRLVIKRMHTIHVSIDGTIDYDSFIQITIKHTGFELLNHRQELGESCLHVQGLTLGQFDLLDESTTPGLPFDQPFIFKCIHGLADCHPRNSQLFGQFAKRW